MEIRYAVSLWNFYHYTTSPTLEGVAKEVSSKGYGLELWPWYDEEKNLYSRSYREQLKQIVKGVEISLHSGDVRTFAEHQTQIDTASYIGGKVIVVHPDNLFSDYNNPDYTLAQDIVDYAKKERVTIALENGPLEILEKAIENVKGLKICLDIGHIYATEHSLGDFLDSLKEHLVHLHLQDYIKIPDMFDHVTCGTGLISQDDWHLFFNTLKEINYRGIAVFEIRPRPPMVEIDQAVNFLKKKLDRVTKNVIQIGSRTL